MKYPTHPHYPISYTAYWYWGSPWPYSWRKSPVGEESPQSSDPVINQKETIITPQTPENYQPRSEQVALSTDEDSEFDDEGLVEEVSHSEEGPKTGDSGPLRWRFPE